MYSLDDNVAGDEISDTIPIFPAMGNETDVIHNGTIAQGGQNLTFSIALPTGSSNEVEYAEVRLRKYCESTDITSYAVCLQNAERIYGRVEIYAFENMGIAIQKVFVTARAMLLNDYKHWEEFDITETVQRHLIFQPFDNLQLHLNIIIKMDPSHSVLPSIDPYRFFQNSIADLTATTQLILLTEKDAETADSVNKDLCLDHSLCCKRSLTVYTFAMTFLDCLS